MYHAITLQGILQANASVKCSSNGGGEWCIMGSWILAF